MSSAKTIRVVAEPRELAAFAGGAFVPTMGALHEGHLALVRRAGPLGRPLVVSIFVNPTQFGPGEDWQRYPRVIESDLEAAAVSGADVVFAPSVDTMYPPGEAIAVPELPAVGAAPGLEDAHRPAHFAGVCQVVARLFDLVRPSVAVFGEKDYQQLLVVTEMARRDYPGVEIVAYPTVREPDGLALSSRNAYLDAGQREQALSLHRALGAALGVRSDGGTPGQAEEAMAGILEHFGVAVDYAVVRDAVTLMPIDAFERPARALAAGRVGDVRLIDNEAL